MRYSLEHGSYYLRDPHGVVRVMVDQVTVAYSCAHDGGGKLWTIHKHGSLVDVRAWWRDNHTAAQDLVGDINLVTFPPQFDPNQINGILQHPARLETFLI